LEFAECGICDFACPLGFQGAKANRTQTIQEKSDFEKMQKLRMLEIKMPECCRRLYEFVSLESCWSCLEGCGALLCKPLDSKRRRSLVWQGVG